MRNEFTAVIEAAPEGGFVAFCPEGPEANGQGPTEQEAISDLRLAIITVLDYKRTEALRGAVPCPNHG